MSLQVVFIVGAPGVGKTTLIESLIDSFAVYEIEKPKWTITPPWALVGHYQKQTFGGGDTLGYTQGADAVRFMLDDLASQKNIKVAILDGDRMSTRNVLQQVREAGLKPQCWHLIANDQALTERCNKRGSNQNPTWAKGRQTKAANFAALFTEPGEQIHQIDTTDMSPSMVRTAFLSSFPCVACGCEPCDCSWGN